MCRQRSTLSCLVLTMIFNWLRSDKNQEDDLEMGADMISDAHYRIIVEKTKLLQQQYKTCWKEYWNQTILSLFWLVNQITISSYVHCQHNTDISFLKYHDCHQWPYPDPPPYLKRHRGLLKTCPSRVSGCLLLIGITCSWRPQTSGNRSCCDNPQD